jgi:hypothetical protein
MSGLSPSSEMALLRRFEPVVRYTRGERFFPMDIERYIEQCSLWVQRPREQAELVVPQVELNVERLSEIHQDIYGAVHFLKFIDPLDLVELARYSLSEAVKHITHKDEENTFIAGRGRLARVGYLSRFMDAVFTLTLLMRGRVPGDTAAAAALTYRRMLAEHESYHYYGRVVRENDWTVLQYWFFYPFNNWRSGFFGVNDHEADWEMISIYCSDEPNADLSRPVAERLCPYWVAYASHDYYGDDLRRRWDDPELEKIGDHPIVYGGAGSHASYYQAGEYLAEVEIQFLTPLDRFAEWIRNIWAGALRQTLRPNNGSAFHVFSVPFVDYARGDGISIGPEQERGWNPVLINPPPGWVKNYRGLWGLYARDPVAGENAPAGPMYNRDGGVRLSWFDPLAWAGVDKVPPPDEALTVLDRRRSEIIEKRERLKNDIFTKSRELSGLGIEAASFDGFPYMESIQRQQQTRIANVSRELTTLRRQLTIYEARLESLNHHEARLMIGDPGPLRAHIHRAHLPSSEVDLRLGSLAEVFSAVSVGILMMGIVLLIVFARQYLLFGLGAMVGLLIFIESSFRKQLTGLIVSLSVGLALVTAFVLLWEFFWPIVVAAVLAAGLYIIWENIREIRRWGG